MKIAFFTDNFPPRLGGVATYSFEMPKHFKELSPETDIEVFVFGKEEGEEDLGGLKIRRLKKQSLWREGLKIFSIIRKGKFNIVHATTFFPIGFFVSLSARLCGVKPFQTVYGTETVTSQGSLLTKLVKRLTLILNEKVFPFSESTKKLTLSRYKMRPEKFQVVYPGISRREPSAIYDVREKYNLAPDDFAVLFVGRLVERKGALDLIKAVESLADEKIKLIMVGGGQSLEEFNQYVNEKGLAQKVFFAGAVPYEEVENYYRAAQLFSMPSFFNESIEDIEGLGIVYLEAQMNGVPVLGTQSGGIPEAIADGKSGFVVKARDISALAEKIKYLKDNPEQARRMSEEAKCFVEEKFSWKQNIDRHLKEYQIHNCNQ